MAPWPSFTEEEAKIVSDLLLSNRVNYWTGDVCREFEKEFADWVGTKYAISLANGTLALDVAIQALNIKPGDEVIVTPRTFFASVSSIVIAGAKPVFADVDRDSQVITAETIAPLITSRTKAIICVHLAGWPCDMDPICDLAKKHNLAVIEDCAQAHGAKYKGRSVGSLGDIGAWSFCQDKILTTGGEGGMITTNNKDLWSKMWAYKDHGKSWQAIYERQHPPGFRWLHDSFGTNFRMLEIQAAIGRIQLKKMSEWTERRTSNANLIASCCKKYSVVRVPKVPSHITHAYYKFYVFVKPEFLAPHWSRDRIIQEINSLGIPCFHGSCPEVYLEQAFEGTEFRPKQRLPISKELGETSILFLVHPTLTEKDIAKTCDVIDSVLALAQRKN